MTEEPSADEIELERIETLAFNMKKLMESAGWQTLEEHFRLIRIGRRNSIFQREKGGLDSLLLLADSMSELAGMEFMMGLPAALRTEAELERSALLDNLNTEEE